MPGTVNRRAVRWLRGQLPELVAAGAISSENAASIERHYASVETRSNFGFVILATVGAALVGAGIILLIAHNWNDLSRAARTIIAFIPLLLAQALVAFVLLRRNDSRAWREAVAVFDVAALATAISLVSQTYQVQGTFDDFMRIWMILSIPIVYLLRTTLGAIVYVVGAVVWLFDLWSFFGTPESPNFFWIFLLLVIPYLLICYRRNRESSETAALAMVVALASIIALGATADFAKSDLGPFSFAGLMTVIYLCGLRFLPRTDQRLSALAIIGGIGIGVVAIVLSFQSAWHMGHDFNWAGRSFPQNVALAIELIFPIVAVVLSGWDLMQRRARFSIVAAAAPVVAAVTWATVKICNAPGGHVLPADCSFVGAAVFNIYALWLGIDILGRGIGSNSIARANFGLVLIAALAMARFFDSDLSFVTRGLGFILVGAGFLVANVLLFKQRATA